MLNLYVSILKIRRVFQIFWILLKYAFKGMFSQTSSSFYTRMNVQHKTVSTPERVRELIEALGPTYVKFGQIVADRPDIVSEKFRIELKKLQSKAVPFPTQAAIVQIEHELRNNIGFYFKEFDLVPLAAASIGQVYAATLKNGEKVVIKIQRPQIENKIKLDVQLMRYLARWFVNKYPELAAFNLVGLVDKFSESIIAELDYHNEANNIKLFQAMFRNDTTVKIPTLYDNFTTKRLIVMERIFGLPPDNVHKVVEAGLDPEVIMQNGATAIFKMILEYGIFHADPHPGNIFLLKENVVAFIDFGMVGFLRPREINFLADYTIGFSKQDEALITRALLELCNMKFFDREEELKFDIHHMLLRNFSEDALAIKNFTSTLQGSIDIILKYQLHIPDGIFMLVKTLLMLEKFADRLKVDLDMKSIILPYSRKVMKERYSVKRLAQDLYDTMTDYVRLVRDLPRDISEILYKLKEGKIKHDIKLEDEAAFARISKQVSLRIAYVILLIGLFMGSSILVVLDYEQKFGSRVLFITLILILFLLIKWMFMKRK